MKLKFWFFEFDFQKDDAKIVIPITLLLIAIIFLDNKNEILNGILIAGVAIYYLLFFFLQSGFDKLRCLYTNIKPKTDSKLKCPTCKSDKIIREGWQEYRSEFGHQLFYCCTKCKQSSMMTDGWLTRNI